MSFIPFIRRFSVTAIEKSKTINHKFESEMLNNIRSECTKQYLKELEIYKAELSQKRKALSSKTSFLLTKS